MVLCCLTLSVKIRILSLTRLCIESYWEQNIKYSDRVFDLSHVLYDRLCMFNAQECKYSFFGEH